MITTVTRLEITIKYSQGPRQTPFRHLSFYRSWISKNLERTRATYSQGTNSRSFPWKPWWEFNLKAKPKELSEKDRKRKKGHFSWGFTTIFTQKLIFCLEKQLNSIFKRRSLGSISIRSSKTWCLTAKSWVKAGSLKTRRKKRKKEIKWKNKGEICWKAFKERLKLRGNYFTKVESNNIILKVFIFANLKLNCETWFIK